MSTGGLGATTGVFPRGGESNYTLVVDRRRSRERLRRRLRFRAPSDGEHRPDRSRARAAERALRRECDRLGRADRQPARRAAYGAVPGRGRRTTTRLACPARRPAAIAAFEWGGSFDQLLTDGMNGERTAAGEIVGNDDYTRRSCAASLGWRSSASWLRGDVRHARRRARLSRSVRQQSDRQLRRDRSDVARREFANAGGRRLVVAALRARPAAGAGELQPRSRATSSARSMTSRQLLAPLDGPRPVGLHRSRRDWISRRAWSSSVSGPAAPTSPARPRRRFRSSAASRATSSKAGGPRSERLFVTGGAAARRHPARRASKNRPCLGPPSAAAGRYDRVAQPAARRRPGWLARRAPTTREFAAPSARASGRPTASSSSFTDNPGLKPERSVSGEAGIDHAFAGGHVLVEATAFTNHYDDLIVAVGSFQGSSRYETDNISNARASGLELALHRPPPVRRQSAARPQRARRLHVPRHEGPRRRSGRRCAAALHRRARRFSAARRISSSPT